MKTTAGSLEIKRLAREAMLKIAPEDLEGDALEVWRIAQQEITNLKLTSDGYIPTRSEMRSAGRSIPALQREAVHECREAIEILRKHLAPKDMTSGQYWSFLVATEDNADQALNSLSSVVDRMNRRAWPMPKSGIPKERLAK